MHHSPIFMGGLYRADIAVEEDAPDVGQLGTKKLNVCGGGGVVDR